MTGKEMEGQVKKTSMAAKKTRPPCAPEQCQGRRFAVAAPGQPSVWRLKRSFRAKPRSSKFYYYQYNGLNTHDGV
jgi:hypothetical protein